VADDLVNVTHRLKLNWERLYFLTGHLVEQ
jgi:hypothetical protein